MFESVLAHVVIDRKGHHIVEEYVDKVINKYPPNQPWQVSLYLHLLSRIHAPDQKLFLTVRSESLSSSSFFTRRNWPSLSYFYPTVWREPVDAENQAASDNLCCDKVSWFSPV